MCEGVANIWESVVVWFKKPQPAEKISTSGGDAVQVLFVL